MTNPAVHWTEAIYELSEALPVAFDVLSEALRGQHDHTISKDAYMAGMEARHVTVSTARDALRYLEQTYVVQLDELGAIAVQRPLDVETSGRR